MGRVSKPGVVMMVLGMTLAMLGAHCAGAQAADDHAWVKALLEQGTGRGALTVKQVEDIKGGVEVIVGLQYPGVENGDRAGLGKLYLPTLLRDEPEARALLVHAAGYEIDRAMGEGMLANKVIICTPHGEEPNPLSRGENLDLAILHRVRALPCVNDAMVTVMGGSAGGYMTLMVTAETFPVTCAMPDVPPVNVGYNCGFIVQAKPFAERQPAGQDHPDLPVTLAVYPIAEGAVQVLGEDVNTQGWLNASPVVRMQEITCPTLITCSTADMLVPMNQFSRDLVKPIDRTAFPEGFTLDMDKVLTDPTKRLELLSTVPERDIEVFIVPCPADAPKLGWDGQPQGPGVPPVEVPFSEAKRFSLVVLDEGAPEPQVGHFKHAVGLNKDKFMTWVLTHPQGPEQLNAAKLGRLMMRLAGKDAHPQTVKRNGKEQPVNRLDFAEVERADVLRSLRTYCQGAGCREHLQELYKALPEDLKSLGAGFGDASAEAVQAALEGK
jgi:hypothetical protein